MPTREREPRGASGSFATRDPGYHEEDPRTFWDRLGELFREDPKKLIEKSKNAMAFSEMLDITPSEAYEYHDELGERVFGEREITTPELIGGLILLPITAAIATNPFGLLLGVTTYQAIAEAESAAISLFKNKKYQVFRNRGLTDLLPEDTAEVTQEIVETFDIIGKMIAAGGVFKTAPKLGNKIARKIMTENRLPRDIYISGKDLKAELQTGGILPQDSLEFYKALGLKGSVVKEALHKGLNIKISAEKVITITDRPWYGKIKNLFRISPYEEVRVTGGQKPTYEFAIRETPAAIEGAAGEPSLTPVFIGYQETATGERVPYYNLGKDTMTKEGLIRKGYEVPEIPPPEAPVEEKVVDLSDRILQKKITSGVSGWLARENKIALDFYDLDDVLEMTEEISKLPEEVDELQSSIVKADFEFEDIFDYVEELGKKHPKIKEAFAKAMDYAYLESIGAMVKDPHLPTRKITPKIASDLIISLERYLEEYGGEGEESLSNKVLTFQDYLNRKYRQGPKLVPPKVEEETKFEEFVKTLPDEMRKGKKLEEVERIFKLLEEKYPEVEDKITRVIQAQLADRHGETMGGVITLSTVDVPTLGHEIGELLQPMAQFGRGKTITGKEAADRDNLSDAIAYVLTEEAGLKTPRKEPSPELLDKARELLSGEKPEIPSPNISDITEEAARGIKKTKTRVRLVTGQTKISDLVREDVALAASLRRAAREARHAMSVGKKEGYEKAKQHYLELREKVKKRIAQKKYVQELIDNINKPHGNIDFFYKEGIENLREGIDPHFRAKKTIEAKERMQRFFKENPDRLAEMPTKFMKELNKKPLNDYTIDDLQKISDEISRLRKLGRTKRKLKLIQQRREFEETKDTIITTITRGKKIEEEIPVVRATRQKARKRAVARALTLRPARIFDKLDRGQRFSGPMHKFFYDEVNKTVDEAYRMTDTRLASSAAKRKELGLSARDILKTRKVDKLKLTVDEMLDIYAGWKNPRKKLALMYGNNITEEMATKIFASLTPKEKQFADWLISEYGRNYSRVREAHIEYANEDMGWEPSYTPIRRMDITPNEYKSEIAEEILVRSNLKKAYVGKQFTIERKNIPREFQKPVHLGLYNTWLDQVPKQERYIHSGMKVKELQKLTSDPDFRQAVMENFGREYLKRLENYNNRVANPQIYKALDEVGKLSQSLRKNMVIAYLSYNLVTMGKQLPSVLLYLPECGPAHLIAAGLQFAANPLKAMRFVNEKDLQVKHRMIERELEEMKYSGKIMKKVGRFGMKGIKGFDRTAVTIGWRAVYNKNVGKLGDEEATRLAQDATLRTQPAAHAKDLPELYTTNEMLNWVLQFTNQLNQIYNIATYDIPRDVRRGRVYKAFLSSLALAMVSLTIYAISNRRLPEDLDDVKEALKEEAIMAIPLIGRTIMAASKGWESPSPALKLAVAAGKLISGAERATKAKAVLEGVLVALGVPYTGPRRVKKALEEGPIELLGPEKPKKRGRRRYR